MGPTAVFVSFRLGGSDGVSVEARKWAGGLRSLGFTTRRVAGEILDAGEPGDTVVAGLAIESADEPPASAVEEAIEAADLVVVDNLVSLPLNLPAARVVGKVLAGHDRVVLRHHDLPWQRDEYADVDELPPRLPGAVHVVINELSRRQLAGRGIDATLIRNHFDLSPPQGDRAQTRSRLGLDAGAPDILVLHPVRAIPRKNVPAALALCEALARRLPDHRVHYWLPGPAEDGYGPTLESVLSGADVRVIREPARPVHDGYAACDLVVLPSTWEGFGNPVVESVAARRPLAVARYPVLDELLTLGFEFLSPDDPDGVAAVVTGATDIASTLDANQAVARRHLSLDLVPGRLAALFADAGWEWP